MWPLLVDKPAGGWSRRSGDESGAAGCRSAIGGRRGRENPGEWSVFVGSHYLSNATCLVRPRSFYELFDASRIIILCFVDSPFLKNTCV